jgi:GntR family transcriptional regulator
MSRRDASIAPLQPGPLPLYYQLERHVAERIRSGEFKVGDLLPSEDRLCAEYGVSRITVRRALAALAGEGLIDRRRGVGTFVAEPDRHVRETQLVGSLDDVLTYSDEYWARLLSRTTVKPDAHVAATLALPGEGRATRLESLLYHAAEPFAYMQLFFPLAVGALIDEAEISERTPVLRLLERKLGERFTEAEETVEAAAADRTVAAHLSLRPRTPILRVVRTYYASGGRPIETAVVSYHPERHRHTVRLVAGRRVAQGTMAAR